MSAIDDLRKELEHKWKRKEYFEVVSVVTLPLVYLTAVTIILPVVTAVYSTHYIYEKVKARYTY
jgi:hypothetical protein